MCSAHGPAAAPHALEARPALKAHVCRHRRQVERTRLGQGCRTAGGGHITVDQRCKKDGEAARGGVGGGQGPAALSCAAPAAEHRASRAPAKHPASPRTVSDVVWVHRGQQGASLAPCRGLHPRADVTGQRLPERQQAVAHRLARQAGRQRRQLSGAVLAHRPDGVAAQVCKRVCHLGAARLQGQAGRQLDQAAHSVLRGAVEAEHGGVSGCARRFHPASHQRAAQLPPTQPTQPQPSAPHECCSPGAAPA